MNWLVYKNDKCMHVGMQACIFTLVWQAIGRGMIIYGNGNKLKLQPDMQF